VSKHLLTIARFGTPFQANMENSGLWLDLLPLAFYIFLAAHSPVLLPRRTESSKHTQNAGRPGIGCTHIDSSLHCWCLAPV